MIGHLNFIQNFFISLYFFYNIARKPINLADSAIFLSDCVKQGIGSYFAFS